MDQFTLADSTLLHPTGSISKAELMPLSKCSQQSQAGHCKGGFCTPPSHPLHRADRYFYHWPLDRWAVTHVATGPAPLSLPPSGAVELLSKRGP